MAAKNPNACARTHAPVLLTKIGGLVPTCSLKTTIPAAHARESGFSPKKIQSKMLIRHGRMRTYGGSALRKSPHTGEKANICAESGTKGWQNAKKRGIRMCVGRLTRYLRVFRLRQKPNTL